MRLTSKHIALYKKYIIKYNNRRILMCQEPLLKDSDHKTEKLTEKKVAIVEPTGKTETDLHAGNRRKDQNLAVLKMLGKGVAVLVSIAAIFSPLIIGLPLGLAINSALLSALANVAFTTFVVFLLYKAKNSEKKSIAGDLIKKTLSVTLAIAPIIFFMLNYGLIFGMRGLTAAINLSMLNIISIMFGAVLISLLVIWAVDNLYPYSSNTKDKGENSNTKDKRKDTGLIESGDLAERARARDIHREQLGGASNEVSSVNDSISSHRPANDPQHLLDPGTDLSSTAQNSQKIEDDRRSDADSGHGTTITENEARPSQSAKTKTSSVWCANLSRLFKGDGRSGHNQSRYSRLDGDKYHQEQQRRNEEGGTRTVCCWYLT